MYYNIYMLEFQEKLEFKKKLYSKVTLLILIVATCFVLVRLFVFYKKQDLARENLSKTASVLESLRARESSLSAEIEKMNTQAGLEEEIREKYGLIKPNEEVIMVVDNNDNEEKPSTTPTPSIWQKLVKYFK